MAENLVDGMLKQMNRCRELVKQYEEIGPAGVFGRKMIELDIARAEQALGGGDVIEMIAAYKALQDCQ